MSKIRVGLLFGGRSGEHEVSIVSARAIAEAFAAGDNTNKYEVVPSYIRKDGIWVGPAIAQDVLADRVRPADLAADATPERQWQFPPEAATADVWFPALHGPNGEDGTIQGFLTLMQKPFVASGVLGSAASMDKLIAKKIFAAAGLPQVDYVAATRAEIWSNPCVFPKLCDRIENALDYPMFVKPANLGSSVGIFKVRSRSELEKALDSAASYDRRIIIEKGDRVREVECAVLGNDEPRASVVGEISYQSDFYDYETKYLPGRADLQIPAPLPDAIAERIREMSVRAFLAVDAAGMARVDFFYLEATQEVLINEINTIPGFTATSMYPQLWQASGIAFPELVDRLVELALERYDSSRLASER